LLGFFFLFIVVSPDWAFPIDLDRNSSMNGGLNMASLLIPTTDSFRAQTLIGLLHARDYPVMMVREVFIVHVGCTRCVTSSTANNMKIHARITLNVEFIYEHVFFYVYFMFEYNDEYDQY
jgi:hypothetical protein